MNKEMTTVVKTGKTTEEAVNEALKMLNAKAEDVDVEILKQAKSGFLGFGSSDAMVKVSLKSDIFGKLLEDENIREASCPEREVVEETQVKEETFVEESSDPVIEDLAEEEASEPEISQQEESDSDSPVLDTEEDIEEDLAEDFEEEIDISDEDVSDEEDDRSDSCEDKKEFTFEEAEKFLVNWLEDILDGMHIIGKVQAENRDGNIYLEIVDISDVDTGIVIGRRAETLNALQYLCSIAINRASKGHRRTYLDVAGYRSRRRVSIEKMARRCAARVKESHKPIRLEAMNAYERRIVHTAVQDMEGIKTLSEGREPYRKVVIHYEED